MRPLLLLFFLNKQPQTLEGFLLLQNIMGMTAWKQCAGHESNEAQVVQKRSFSL